MGEASHDQGARRRGVEIASALRERPMQRTKAPFRADHVGSLLRPAPLKEARAKREKGEITAEQLKQVEDREIEKIIKKQEDVGLKLATDGEFRRSWWQFDFYKGLDGVELYSTGKGITFAGVETKAESVRVVGQGRFLRPSAPRAFPLPQGPYQRGAEDDDPGALDAAFPPGPAIDRQAGLSRHRRLFPRRRIGLSKSHPGVLRRRLPLPAARRHRLVDDLRSEGAGILQATRRRSRPPARAIRPHDQPGARRPSRRHGGHHAFLPRQFPLHLHRPGRLRAMSRIACWARSTSTAISWNTTPIAPVASSRCASCPRARSRSCSASSPRRVVRWKRRTTSSGASTRRRNMSTSISSASPRNAASPRPRKAISWPRTNNGPSFA